MSKTSKPKKVLAAGLAAVIAASTAMAGTLAWQSLNQEATNVLSGVVNPGGRLHDDFDGDADKDIYVENFGTQKIYARIMLSEFLAMADGITPSNVDDTIKALPAGQDITLLGKTYDDTSTYTPYNFTDGGIADRYWKKLFGNETGSQYLPTYNMNQDSLAPDLNGYNVYEGFPVAENAEQNPNLDGDAAGEEWRINDGSVDKRIFVESGGWNTGMLMITRKTKTEKRVF